MRIKPDDLAGQYRRAVVWWPFFHDVERAYGLPSFLLFALGSRETDLRHEFTEGATGDKGHGHGLFQLDDRWHVIPPGFDTDPRAQADTAATKLDFDADRWGDWISTLNYYNSGSPHTEDTTGGDYGPDVWARRVWLRDNFGGTVTDNAFALAGVLDVEADALADVGRCVEPVDDGPMVAFAPGDLPTADDIRAIIADFEARSGRGDLIVWVPGWERRGRPYDFRPECLVCHHTADRGYDADYPALGIVRDGRDDLPGPLSQFGIGRHDFDGWARVYVVAAGTANHAGPGSWDGVSGNTRAYGIEWASDGVGEEVEEHHRRTYRLLNACILRRMGRSARRQCDHKEWSNAGKIDRTGFDPDEERAAVQAQLDGSDPIDPTPPEEDDEMPLWHTTELKLNKGEDFSTPEVPVPPSESSGGIKYGTVVVSFSAPEDVTLKVWGHHQDGAGVPHPGGNDDNEVVVPGRSGRHGGWAVPPGVGSLQVELVRPDFADVWVSFEIDRSA